MKRKIIALIYATLICSIAIAQNRVNAPRIISTLPTFGDCNVDSGLTEIIIKFDQDMLGNISIGKSLNMPEVIGQPKWGDQRTLSIPVKLYPNKRYTLAFNTTSQKFASTSGILLNPDELHFQTMTVANEAPNQSEALNKKAYKEFMEIFPKQYSYALLNGIDWETVLEKNRAELENAKTNTEFALKLVKLLRLAEDPHLSVIVDGQRFETKWRNLVEYNYNYKVLSSKLQDKKVSGGFLTFTGVIDSVGYISIGDWKSEFNKLKFKPWGDTISPGITAEDALKDLFRYPNLIIDVRVNSGGDETYAKEFASYFVKKSMPYEKVKLYNEKTGLFDKEHLKELYPNTKKMNYSGNIYVLSGPSVFSSNESFILMMKQISNAKVVGMKTYGSSGNPLPHALSNGVIVNLPSWQAYTLDGKPVEGNGVEPTLEIKTTKQNFVNKDALVKEVLKIMIR